MDKKKIKLIVIFVPLILAISTLTGCFEWKPIHTRNWYHLNSEGTAVTLWGFLVLSQSFQNWDGYFVYDTEYHENWEDYEFRVPADTYDSFNFFLVNLYGLDRLTEYHYRAVGEHKQHGSIIRPGDDKSFIPGGPRVKVHNASAVGVTSATLEGELTHMGGAASCEVFFRYGTDPDNLDMETTHETMTSNGKFDAEITGLSSCQSYYYQALAINDADTWDSEFTFRVNPGMPTVETFLPHEVTETSAKFRGKLFSLGGTATCDVWFEYGDDNPNNLDETTDNITLDSTGEFFIIEEGLTPDTTYWVRAVANNGVCEHKGQIKKFRTFNTLNSDHIQ
jgi:hypothetical protein